MYILHNATNCKEGTNVECGIQETLQRMGEGKRELQKSHEGFKCLEDKQCQGKTKLVPTARYVIAFSLQCIITNNKRG